jgi:hypothetical protein
MRSLYYLLPLETLLILTGIVSKSVAPNFPILIMYLVSGTTLLLGLVLVSPVVQNDKPNSGCDAKHQQYPSNKWEKYM